MSSEPVQQEESTSGAPAGDFISSVQAAGEFGYSNDHIARICRLGEVACERDGKLWKVSRASLEAYVEATLKAEEERRRAQSEQFRKELHGDSPSRTVFVPRVAQPSPYETFARTVATHATIFFLAFAISVPLGQLFHSAAPTRVAGMFSFDVPSREQRGAVLGVQTSQLALSFQPSTWISALSDLLWSEPQVYVPPPVVLRELVPVTSGASSPATPTTLIQNITQPLTISGVSSDLLTTRLQELENELRNEIYLYSARAERGISGNYRAIGLTNVINNLDGVTIRNATIIGGSISGTSGIGGGGASDLDDLSDVTITSPALGQVLLYDGSTWNNVATSSLGITGGGSSFGQGFELTSGALAPTTTVGVLISASSTISSLTVTNGTTTNATSTNLFTSNLTLGSLTGLLRATAGVVATATIDLVNDVGSSILAVANGGTGWASLQANSILLGNGTSRLATTSAGTNGQILSLVSGVPSWVATTTFSGGLTYSGGNVTADCVTITGSASLCDGDDATGGGASFGQTWETGPFGYIAPTSTRSAVIIGATTTAQNAHLGIYATSTTGDLVFASSTASFAGNFFKAVASAGTTMFQIAANGVASFASNLVPTANDGASLGISGTAFSDLFLASGGVINFLAGDVSLTHSADTLTFGGAASGYIFNDGYVGVASSSPWAKLAVNPVAGDVNQFVVGSSTATSFIINSAGRVGIGTSTPTQLLAIAGNSTVLSSVDFSDDTSFAGFTITQDGGGGTGIYQIGSNFGTVDRRNNTEFQNSLGGIAFWTGGALTERLRITSTGNVGIGTTTADSLLSLVGADPVLLIKDTETGTANTNTTLRFAESGASGVTDQFVDLNLGSSGTFSFIDNYTAGGGTGTRFVINDSGNVGVGTTTPWRRLSVADTVSTAQFALAYDTTRYATFQVDSSGDLIIDAQGGDASFLDENLYVCTGGSCPAGPAGTGNLLVEGILILPNGTAPTVSSAGALALDTSGDDQLLVADEGGTARVIQTKQKIWSVTVASTSPAFISAGLLPIPVELDGYTMTDIRCKVDTGTSKVIAIEDAGALSTEDITCATTVTSDDGSITNATATAAEEMYIDFGATSGAVDYVSITVYGYWTRE